MSASTTDDRDLGRLGRGDTAGRGLRLAALGLAALALLPPLALAVSAGSGSPGLWAHLTAHVLPRATLTTLLLLGGVGALVAVIGTGCAWLVTAYAFPGSRVLSWALLLPLAVPTYIAAYAYLDLMHPLGAPQTLLRALLGIDDPRGLRLPDVRSLGGAIVLLGFVLYPYVYLSTRAMFVTQAANLLEAARSLGAGPLSVFLRIALPLARPAIAVGMVLALLETLNDIGASEFLGVQTLTVSIYTTWITRSDLPGAAQISLAMLSVVALLVFVERVSRGRQRYTSQGRSRPLVAKRLGPVAGLAALAVTALPLVVGFVLPVGHLVHQTWRRLEETGGVSVMLVESLQNTLLVSVLTTAAVLACALVLAWTQRLAQLRGEGRAESAALRLASIGYAIPGTVLAIGLLAPLGWIDARTSQVLSGFGHAPRLWVMGTLFALVLACALRFLGIAAGNLEAGFSRIPHSLDQAARSLGSRPLRVLTSIGLPLLRPALATGALLVFVDTMKELPATLMLRPIGFETLATWLYADAARGAYEEGAIAALLIVLAGLLPVIVLARAGRGPAAGSST